MKTNIRPRHDQETFRRTNEVAIAVFLIQQLLEDLLRKRKSVGTATAWTLSSEELEEAEARIAVIREWFRRARQSPCGVA